jgi:hypothetical protein
MSITLGVDNSITGKYYKVSRQTGCRFYGSTKKLYNVYWDVCCHAVYAIDDYDIDQPNPDPHGPKSSKGRSLGLTCWDILQYFTYDIVHMNLVLLNGVHTDGDDE